MPSCQPCASAASSFCFRSGRASAVVMPKASKPSARARASSAARISSALCCNILFHQHADVARVGDAAGFGLVLHRVEQTFGNAHVHLRFLLLELEVMPL